MQTLIGTITLRSDMGNANHSVSAPTKYHNRVGGFLVHATRYSCRGIARLAEDSGLSKATISSLVHGQTNPRYSTIDRIVKCLAIALKRPIALEEVMSESGTYPTPFICPAAGCKRCLPDSVFESDGERKSKYRSVKPGQWTGDSAEFKGGPVIDDGDESEATETKETKTKGGN